MSDNTKINKGVDGDEIATDDILGVKYPRSKIVIGKNNINDGDVAETNPMPVKGRTIAWNAPTFVAVGTSTTVILASNTSRLGAVLVNDGNKDIYLGIGAAAVVGSGILLNSGGGAYEINLTNLTTQAINGISTGGGSNLTVHEAI